ncbi:MAG TPA: sigma-54 dependent transcriptional regulator, partial [Gammaproteobacteria bacterium]|nr:sigma-54 dependent transcriptional regulator [Gammaproteobacteria bacterium]
LSITLKRMDLDCHCAENLAEAHKLLGRHTFNICLTDMRLPDGDGVDFVGYTQEHYPDLPIAVITAHGNMETAIQALKSGAYDFLTKPIDLSSLRTLVTSALKLSAAHRQGERKLIGTSQATEDIRQSIAKLARSQAPVYISGESGTGKELVARMIHEQGPRSEFPFVPVNCGAIPHDLMESEFFGHVKGSFTGAVASKEGLFAVALGGTLFFDEIAELPQHMQVKLLRVIQEKSFRPVGATYEQATDVRILSATHNDLTSMVKEGRFRQDLFYRINVIELHILPLRERTEDIPLLIDHVLQKLSDSNKVKKSTLDEKALSALCNYVFPGNVRELENILERAITLCDNYHITEDDLQLPDTGSNESGNTSVKDGTALDKYLGDIERQTILDALEKTRWNKTAAAKLLGISLRALRYRLGKLGLE